MTDDIYSFESPESTAIYGATYDADTETCVITFKKKDGTEGGQSTIPGFPLALWEEWTQAGSKGQFFNARVRPVLL